MSYKSVLVLSDNETIVQAFIQLLNNQPELGEGRRFNFACYPKHESLKGKEIINYIIEPLNIKEDYQSVIDKYDLIISAHCKQIFPDELVRERKCINIHPGFNPYNRGWYPQVFSIINGLPLGATIHEIDEELDHGKIIDQEKIEVDVADTSLSAYNKVQDLELKLLERNLQKILDGDYTTHSVKEEGNINFKKDFEALREINLDEQVTFQQALDRLRALSHPPFKNAYFIDPVTNEQVWVQIELERDQS